MKLLYLYLYEVHLNSLQNGIESFEVAIALDFLVYLAHDVIKWKLKPSRQLVDVVVVVVVFVVVSL